MFARVFLYSLFFRLDVLEFICTPAILNLNSNFSNMNSFISFILQGTILHS